MKIGKILSKKVFFLILLGGVLILLAALAQPQSRFWLNSQYKNVRANIEYTFKLSHTEIVEERKSIPGGMETIADYDRYPSDNPYNDYETKQKGSDGEKIVTYKKTVRGHDTLSKVKIGEHIVTQPVKAIFTYPAKERQQVIVQQQPRVPLSCTSNTIGTYYPTTYTNCY